MSSNNETAKAEATKNRDEARTRFNSAIPGSKQWNKAADDLEFWIGKVAAYECFQDWN